MKLQYTDPKLVSSVVVDPVAPLHRSTTGYGGKIPTRVRIRYANRFRRVYMMQYGNSGTPYVVYNFVDCILDPETEQRIADGNC